MTREVNENKNFSQLRQVYNSLILAAWYKKKIRGSLLAQVYEDKNKISGVQYNSTIIPARAGIHFKNDVEGLYQEYLKAFKKGVFNFIKEDQSAQTVQSIPRKYFSGGFKFNLAMLTYASSVPDAALLSRNTEVDIILIPAGPAKSDSAMTRRTFVPAVALALSFLKRNLNAQSFNPVHILGSPHSKSDYLKEAKKFMAQLNEGEMAEKKSFSLLQHASLEDFKSNYIHDLKKYMKTPEFNESFKSQIKALDALRVKLNEDNKLTAIGLEFTDQEITNLRNDIKNIKEKYEECGFLKEIDFDVLVLNEFGPALYLDYKQGMVTKYLIEKAGLNWKIVLKEFTNPKHAWASLSNSTEFYLTDTFKEEELKTSRIFDQVELSRILPILRNAQQILGNIQLIGLEKPEIRFKKRPLAEQLFIPYAKSYEKLVKLDSTDDFKRELEMMIMDIDTYPELTPPSKEAILALSRKYPRIKPDLLKEMFDRYIQYFTVAVRERNPPIVEKIKDLITLHKIIVFIGTGHVKGLVYLLGESGVELTQHEIWSSMDNAMTALTIGPIRTFKGDIQVLKNEKGGIDLTPARMYVQTTIDPRLRLNEKGIQFHLDYAMIAQFKNAPGFSPRIINIHPMNNLRIFLGLSDKP